MELSIINSKKKKKKCSRFKRIYEQIQTSIQELSSLERTTETYGLLLVHHYPKNCSQKFENRIWDLPETLKIKTDCQRTIYLFELNE